MALNVVLYIFFNLLLSMNTNDLIKRTAEMGLVFIGDKSNLHVDNRAGDIVSIQTPLVLVRNFTDYHIVTI